MSDKHHVQNDEPWTHKSANPTATGGIATRLPYNTGAGVPPSPLHPDINFAAARFQAPLVHQQHVNSQTIPTASYSHMAPAGVATQPTAPFAHHHHAAPSIAASNVPVFPPVTAAAASVLTPNPFAAVTGATATATTPGAPPTPGPFALQQFFHAMNSAAVATLAANQNVCTPLTLNPPTPGHLVAPSTTSPAAMTAHALGGNRTAAVDLPSPSSTSSASVQIGGSSSGGGGAGGSSGAITNTITENVLNAISGLAQNTTPARNMSFGIKAAPDEDKLRRVHQMVEAGVGEQAKQQIVQILDCISTLKPVEKLLLYLRLPGAAPETDPLRQPQNPLGTRSEINHTINWVRSHLEQDPNVSIPKQDVYNDYIAYCERLDIKPLSTADFGKVMKQVFPGIRPRRLGTRGHSRYCYAAMRKTTKLPSPQLPQLSTDARKTTQTSGNEKHEIHESGELFLEETSEAWTVIKTWAESLLQIKFDNAKELADRIKTGNMPANLGSIAAGGNITHKKFGNRETKEKRALTDMGPLKKRRKKKRKGSSSSESSFNSQPPLKQANSDKDTAQQASSAIQPFSTSAVAAHPASNVDENSLNLIKVKEEVMDSPNFQQVQHLTPPARQNATLVEGYLQQQQQQQQQQQIWPMNLAPEQRSVLTRAQTNISALNTANLRGGNPGVAAKNLVPKIMELAAANTEQECNYQQSAAFVPTIKEEEIDEYNPSNILCKKVRKAQQTKGFWQQTTTTTTTTAAAATSATVTTLTPIVSLSTKTTSTTTISAHVVPVITTSAPTPTPPDAAIAAPASATPNVPSPVSNLLMGPPAAASSTSPFAAVDNGGGNLMPTPKVASKNTQQLRAKRMQLLAAAAAAASANEANLASDELPEDLGLPRERVISICNMDKHELDDYFINGDEEDSSNDQETELLQYFQTGDAEEKLNSLDAGKQRNLTAAATSANSQASNAEQVPAMRQQQNALQSMSTTSSTSAKITKTTQNNVSTTTTMPTPTTAMTSTTTSTATTTSLRSMTKFAENAAMNLLTTFSTTKTPIATNATLPAVGSASASLALLSQKHQNQRQQQPQPQQQQQQTQQPHEQEQLNQLQPINNTTAPKRKIPPSSITTKHCTFAPISPNINGSSNGPSNGIGSAPATSSNGTAGGGFFASPGITPTRLRPKPALLGKQQSLDNDFTSGLSFPTSAINTMHDPMIGATRRRRNYVNVTSASAPPSPSILHQQQQQQQHNQYFNVQQFQNAAYPWQSLLSSSSQPPNSGFLNDQNSLDLDLFGAANSGNATSAGPNFCNTADGAGALSFDDYVAETQRSQSVPLSQLQRIHSPPVNILSTMAAKQCQRNVDYITENSLLCSDNSSSQQSNPIQTPLTAGIIKLEDNAATDVMVADSATLLDGVDVCEILSSPDFMDNFTSIAQQKGNAGNSIIAATTTCSSAGSSSGYSSVACPIFSSGNSGNNIMSRSVPSTPLPHHHQNVFGQSAINFYGQRRRSGIMNDELQLSPNNGFVSNSNKFSITTNNNVNNSNNNGNISFANTFGSRSIYDMSKSMPTTPITTPSFRYSPEFNRDFLINGNTIDDTISFSGVGSDSLMGNSTIVGGNSGISTVGDDSVNLVGNLNADALLTPDDVSVPGADDVLLGNL